MRCMVASKQIARIDFGELHAMFQEESEKEVMAGLPYLLHQVGHQLSILLGRVPGVVSGEVDLCGA